jgi:hypothetical protein
VQLTPADLAIPMLVEDYDLRRQQSELLIHLYERRISTTNRTLPLISETKRMLVNLPSIEFDEREISEAEHNESLMKCFGLLEAIGFELGSSS